MTELKTNYVITMKEKEGINKEAVLEEYGTLDNVRIYLDENMRDLLNEFDAEEDFDVRIDITFEEE